MGFASGRIDLARTMVHGTIHGKGGTHAPDAPLPVPSRQSQIAVRPDGRGATIQFLSSHRMVRKPEATFRSDALVVDRRNPKQIPGHAGAVPIKPSPPRTSPPMDCHPRAGEDLGTRRR
ncbi:hypothetical protein KL86PLE_20165 [uncultured Pleomorphomonas sp.]|uniref:Uncharacterized protein n=1 Tax=uncultured Pleomorphomonas sp. TaxID=442121 RepID=A0A212LDE4_9HYPH|nr:hypothetical protein KL86PLE_20165 [uncultured Pleomorphomonas sp.]